MGQEERAEERLREETNLGLPLDNDFEIVCAMTGQPAELFTRNPQQRLVPLTRKAFEQMQTSQKNMASRYSNWTGFSYEETSLEVGKDEYIAQTPSPDEKKRRELANLMRGLVVETILWSSKPVNTAEAVAYYMKGGSLEHIVITELNDHPQPGMHLILLANRAVTPDQLRMLWDMVSQNTTQVPNTQ